MKITETSEFAIDFLKKHTGQYGTVHSVYRKTVNISVDGQLLALQAANSPLSPLSLITDADEYSMSLLSLAKNDIVKIHNSQIEAGSSIFDYSTASAEDLSLLPCDNDCSAEELRKFLHTAIPKLPPIGFVPLFQQDNASDMILDSAGMYMRISYKECEAKHFSSAADILSKLIGLGTGLTPSGDDFLCGVLAGLTLIKNLIQPFGKALSASVKSRLDDTNDLGRAFLMCALNGQFSQAVKNLQKVPETANPIDLFLKIGHSSGLDTLCGIYFALSLPL